MFGKRFEGTIDDTKSSQPVDMVAYILAYHTSVPTTCILSILES